MIAHAHRRRDDSGEQALIRDPNGDRDSCQIRRMLSIVILLLRGTRRIATTEMPNAPPHTRIVTRGENTAGYARRADRLSVYLPQGELIAVIEIVSPGNKDNTNGLKAFVRKAGKLLRRGVHLLVVDLFPPSVRDPHGIHKAIWDQFKEEPFELPPDKPLTLAAYAAGFGESRLRRECGGRGSAGKAGSRRTTASASRRSREASDSSRKRIGPPFGWGECRQLSQCRASVAWPRRAWAIARKAQSHGRPPARPR